MKTSRWGDLPAEFNDVELIPKESFTGLLTEYASEQRRPYLPQALQSLWAVMDQGGFAPALHTVVRRFNGKLFHDATALPLNADQLALLRKAAEANWREVEPAIFGTLLERALDPKERHSLGAHYTPRRYVERLVLPTVIEPLRREWAAAQAASAQHLAIGKGKKVVAEAREELLRFLRRLTAVRVLDPACGSGNFLYVTLEHLKRLERLVQLNHERQQEEAVGTVRYLRPAYQAPGLAATQSAQALPATAQGAALITPPERQPWPTDLAPQMQAVRAVVQNAALPLTAAQVAAHFRGAKSAQVQTLLDTLAALALLRHLENELAYAA